jgi:hypothetical protein
MLGAMPEDPQLPPVADVIAELRLIRERSLVRLRHSDLPGLSLAASRTAMAADQGSGAIEVLLRAAVTNLGGGDLGAGTVATFGLSRGARGTAAPDRRRRAALAYGVSVERFRKHHERIVIEQVAEEILKLCQEPAQPGEPAASADYGPKILLAGRAGDSAFPIVVHIEPVELLSNVDIIVVPENTYLELPQPFKSSVSAAVRNAAAIRSADGEIVTDVIGNELRSWIARHGRPGLPVAPGTIVPTSPGQLVSQGIRRIYHAAVVSPRPGTNRYDVNLTAIAITVRNALALARRERPLFEPELRSVGFPLLGAGRGSLNPATSFAWLWTSLSRDIEENGPWEIHFITQQQALADLIVSKLAEVGAIATAPDSTSEPASEDG